MTTAACGGGAGADELRSDVARESVGIDHASAVPAVLAATDQAGIDLLALTRDQNTVVSPASLVIALSMVGEGAKGDTAQELDAFLGADGAARSAAVNALTQELSKYEGDPAEAAGDELPDKPILHVANNVVVDDQAAILPAYLEALARSYGAGVSQADLGDESGKEILDAWVSQQTGGLIEKSAIEPGADLRLVLQNAVVLGARWDQPFARTETTDRPFTLADGSEVRPQTMAQSGYFALATYDGWRAVRLPYDDAGLLHADVILPPKGSGPADVTPEVLANLAAALSDTGSVQRLELTLPKVDLDVSTDLLPLLREQTPSLVGAADLSGISTAEALTVTQAAQQTVLRIDEEGTVAAAVTEVGVGVSAPAPPDVSFHVDRPYLVRLAATVNLDPRQSWTIFLANVMDPTQ